MTAGRAPTSAPVASRRRPPPTGRDPARRHAQRPAGEVRRGRRVHRVVRRIELWSVLKLSLIFYLCLYLAVLIALAVLWGLAYSTGSVDKVERFLADVGLDNFRFYGDQMFRACAAIGGVLVLAGTLHHRADRGPGQPDQRAHRRHPPGRHRGGRRRLGPRTDVPTGDGDNGARTRSGRPAAVSGGRSDRFRAD